MISSLKKTSLALLSVLSSLFLIWITTRYFPVEPDVVNSPLVWRHVVENGLTAIHDWKPTIDNWYFTVYPVNFLIFSVLDDDGIVALRLATSLFPIGIAIFAMLTTRKYFGYIPGLCSLILLSLIPAFSYTYGFMAHPFSHNSTNAYGFLCLLLSVLNLKHKSFIFTIFISTIALLSGVSDPWFMASFFIPLLLSYLLMCYWDKKTIPHAFIIFLFCIIALSNVIQNALDIPPHHFKLVEFSAMLLNLKWATLLIGKSLNLFIIDNDTTSILSFFAWFIVILSSAIIYIKKMEFNKLYIISFCLLSIAGIVSSFIISYESPDYISSRFFMNVTCFAIVMCCAGMITRLKVLFYAVAILFSLSSINSYINNKAPLHDQTVLIKSYVDFLKRNDLHYGYGSFWDKSITVNWLSGGDVHITPVFFNPTTGRIDFMSVRQQTLTSWHTAQAFESAPERQFIAVTTANHPERCLEMAPCLTGIEEQVGKPDEVLDFGDTKILIYNRRLNI